MEMQVSVEIENQVQVVAVAMVQEEPEQHKPIMEHTLDYILIKHQHLNVQMKVIHIQQAEVKMEIEH